MLILLCTSLACTGFPVVILMVLSGLVFWAAVENRIDATMTILLAISALYIVVFGNIPMIGYLTAFDKYVIGMFFLLTCAVAVHQFVYRVSAKADRRPLRLVLVRIVEFFGRVFLFPVAIIMFIIMFPGQFLNGIRTPVLVIISLIMVAIAWRDFGGVRKVFLNTMIYFEEVSQKDDLESMNIFELKVFYFYNAHMKSWCFMKKKKHSDNDDEDVDVPFDDDDHNYAVGPKVERAKQRESLIYGGAPPTQPHRRGSAISGSHNNPMYMTDNNPMYKADDGLSGGFADDLEGTEMAAIEAQRGSTSAATIAPFSGTEEGPVVETATKKILKRTSVQKQELIDRIKKTA
jgi:hypothetical protein